MNAARPFWAVVCVFAVLTCQAGADDQPSSSWLGQAQQELADLEYHASENNIGLQAPNRAQGFRTYFNTSGISLVKRDSSSSPLTQMQLISLGRRQSQKSFGDSRVSFDGNQVSLDWPDITVRYTNSTEGLRQQMMIARKPAGRESLALTMEIESATVNHGGQEMVLGGNGDGARIDQFFATDALGLELPLTVVVDGLELNISVEDGGAKYPVSIGMQISAADVNRLETQQVNVEGLASVSNVLLEFDQADAQFGVSVAGAGDVNGDGFGDVVVGAYLFDDGEADEGVAFVYFGGPGNFDITPDARLQMNQPQSRFGFTTASAGDVNGDGFDDIVVGAWAFSNGQYEEGAAFIYFGGAGAFNLTVDAQLEVNQQDAWFGYSVAGAGDVNGDGFDDVIIGSRYFENGQIDEGAAFIYFGGFGPFNTTLDAHLEGNQANALFGSSVAGAGDVNGDQYDDVVVGALYYSKGQTNEGAAFLYLGGSGGFNTGWDAHLQVDQADALFGSNVAGAGDVNGDYFDDIIVGASDYDHGRKDEGAAFIFFGGAGAFNLTFDARLVSDQASAAFGYGASGAGDVNGDGYADVIVGAPLFDQGEVNEGMAFLYFGGAGVFNTVADAQLQMDQEGAWLGYSAAGAGDVNGDGYDDIIVGANYYDNGQDNEGAAFMFMGGPGSFNSTADADLGVNQVNDGFGVSVAGAGDVNGDGFADVLVGAHQYDNGQIDEGAVFLFFGGAGAFNTTFDARLELNQAGARFGLSVSGAGDVNGDGYADIIIGSPLYENGQPSEGAAFIYFGNQGVFDTTYDGLVESNQFNSSFGWSVAGVGDVNGDGYADVMVGARWFEQGETKEGAVFLYFGGVGAFNTTYDALLEVNQANASFGFDVAGAGDVNADGFADVVVGAPFYSNGESFEGSAFLYLGKAGAFDTTIDALLDMNKASASFGYSVAGAGDVNGDGYGDIIVGAQSWANGQTNEGASFIYFGGSGPFNLTADAQLESNQTDAHFGHDVAGAGDINGDGFGDVIVGAPLYDSSPGFEGAIFIYFGKSGGFDPSADLIFESGSQNQGVGVSVAGAGDLNGDGYADLVSGAPSPFLLEGSAFIYYGGADNFSSVAQPLLEANQADSAFGVSTAGAGDVNGDGYSDILIGAFLFDNGQEDEGVAFLYFGGAGTLDTTPDAMLEVDQAGAAFGISLAGAGDVNGDGFSDVIIGATYYDNGQHDEGAAFIYFGGAGPFNTAYDARLESNQSNSLFGNRVAGAGDTNGDGYSDVLVGAPWYDNGQMDEGVAFLYLGGIGFFDSVADAQLEGNQGGARFGQSIAGAGDVNGDGYADVIVGAGDYNNGQGLAGAVFLYAGGSQPLGLTLGIYSDGKQTSSYGASISGAGDVNGDGYSDFIVGATNYRNGGAAFVYFGRASQLDAAQNVRLESNQQLAYFGASVAGAGDVNGDGYADLIVGAFFYDHGQNDEGAAFVYFGGPGKLSTSWDAILEPNQPDAYFGNSVSGVGDVNGDGFADLIVGARLYNNGQSDEGAAFVYFGRDGGQPVLARQLRGDGSATPVDSWGSSLHVSRFTGSVFARSPRGLERSRVQAEACPAGASFGSQLCVRRTSSSWLQVTPAAGPRTLLVDGLNFTKLYHWRIRVLYAPYTVTAVGITAPPNPSAGPWRRLYANAGVADIRISDRFSDLIFYNGFE